MRQYIFGFLCVMAVCKGSAQESFSYGIFGGFNIAKLSPNQENVSGRALPAVGLFAAYRTKTNVSFELNSSYSKRGERLDRSYVRLNTSFIDANAIVRVHFLNSFSLGTGFGYYHILSSGTTNSAFGNETKVRSGSNGDISQAAVPIELGMRFQNDATLHLGYSLAVNGGFNNPSLTFRFPVSFRKGPSRRTLRKAVAMQHIRDLNEGMLLVRLHTGQPLIDALTEREDWEKLDKIEQRVKLENESIVEAFKTKFDFTEVYFFYSQHSTEVKNGDFSGLINSDFEAVNLSVEDSMPKYYIAEFANLKPDKGRYVAGSRQIKDSSGVKTVPIYGNSFVGADFRALIIKNKDFDQLRKPFPYYSRSFSKSLRKAPEEVIFLFPIINRLNLRHEDTVHEMNVSLKSFRERAMED